MKSKLLISALIATTIIIGTIMMQKAHSTPLDIQKTLQEYVEDNDGVGAAVGYIDNGKIEYYTYGKKAVDGNDPITQDSIFEIGSITKVFTTITLLEMVKQGKIHLEDPIEMYLPDIKVPEKDGKKITVWHLATHTSGLPSMPDNFEPKNMDNPYADYSAQNLYTFLKGHTLTRLPGQNHQYSNLGMGLLSHILCLIEKTDYEALIKKYICDPLNMKSTGVVLTPSMKINLAHGHNILKKVGNWDFDVLAGAGAIRSNIKDMTIFLAANMGMIDTPLYESIQASHAQQCPTSMADHVKQCVGWIANTQNDGTITWHNGGTGGYRSFMGFDIKNKKGIVILSNAGNCSVDPLGLYILDQIHHKLEKQVYNEALATPEYLGKFVGTYETEPIIFNGISMPKAELEITLLHNKLYYANTQLLPDQKNVFRVKNAPDTYKVHFIMDEKDTIVEVQSRQPEGIFKAFPKK